MSKLALQLISDNKNSRNRKLDLGYCGLTVLPDELFDCIWLEELILSNEWWDNEIKDWVFSENKGPKNLLSAISPKLARLNKLRCLKAGGRYDGEWSIENIEFLKGLKFLKTLDLNSNKISNITYLQSLSELQYLDLSKNQISEVKYLYTSKDLRYLDLKYNQISAIKIFGLSSTLQYLDLSRNYISDLNFIRPLTSLEYLNLRYTQIFDISFLQSLKKLRVLDLSDNQIKDFGFLRQLNFLQYLILSRNQISDISFLQSFESLTYLDLSYNQISSLNYIQAAKELSYLNICDNQISNISELNFLLKEELSEVNLSNNYVLNQLPAEVVKADWPAIKEWLVANSEKSGVPINEIKLLLLGNTTSGKSTLLDYLEKDCIPQESNSTFGIQYRLISLSPQNIKINCWDFGGQEYFHATHQLFFSPGALHLVMWNRFEEITKNVKEKEIFELDYWFRCIEQLLNSFEEMDDLEEKAEVIVCENKLKNTNGYFEISPVNQYTYSEIFKKINFEFKHINLIPEIKEYLTALKDSIILKSRMLCKRHSPKVKEYIHKIRNSNENYMNLQEFGNDSLDVIMSRLKVIRNMGIVIYFENIMPHKVFTKPQVLLDLLYKKILSNELQQSSRPYIITKNEIKESLKTNDLGLSFDEILTILKQFNLVFEISTAKDILFIPQYMEEKSIADMYMIEKAYQRENIFIKSDYYLMNLAMLKIYSRYGTNIKIDDKRDYLFWKDGLIIEKGEEMLLIKFNRKAQRIELYPTVGSSNFNLQQQVVDYVLDIPLYSEQTRVLGFEKDGKYEYNRHSVSWRSKYFDVYVGNSTGYFISWKKLVNEAQSGVKESVFFANGMSSYGDEVGKRIEFCELNNFLPDELQIVDVTKEVDNLTPVKPEVFFSYAWGEEREEIVDRLYESLAENNKYKLYRDKKDIGYKDLISVFMQKIGKAQIIIVVLSDKYLRSEYCMFELYEIFRNSKLDLDELKIKIFPVLVEKLTLNKATVQQKYIKHWQKELLEWDKLKSVSKNFSESQNKKYRIIQKINSELGELLLLLSDINVLTQEILSENNFQKIKVAIENRIKILQQNNSVGLSI